MVVERFIGSAKTPQIDGDDPVVLRQFRPDRLPCETRRRESVEQKNGAAFTPIQHREAQRPGRRIHSSVFDLGVVKRHHRSARG